MTKKILMIAGTLLVLGAPIASIAQSDVAQAQAGPMIDGEVTKIDESAGKMTIKHGPIKKLGMDEGMTMVFRAQDPAMLKTVKAGDKIKFDADKVNGQFTVIKLQKAK